MMKIHVDYKVICLVAVSIFSLPQPSNCTSYVDPNFHTNVDVYENATIGDVVTNITDRNPGNDRRIVEVKYVGSDHDFYIRHGNGVWSVILNTTLDYDQGFTKRTLPIQAKGSGTTYPADIFITLHVQDVNDNAPVFLHQPYNAEVDEDASAGTTVYTNIAARDVDTSRGGTFTFQLLGVSEGQRSKFVIDRIHGIVTLNGSLDYESRTFYHYKVVAKDEGIPSLSSTTDLFITVKDVQDSPPVFTNRPYVTSVQENTHVGHSVLTVTAVDQDRAIPNKVAYNITNSTCQGMFRLDATSGEISVASALDRDVAPLKDLNGLCVITVQATEQNGAHRQKGKFTAVATATITVRDVNDNAPTFSRTSFSASISENSPAGTPLQLNLGQQITVTDIDEGSYSEIQLSLESGAGTFELVTSRLQSSGSVQLRVKNSTNLDFETLPSLVVKITASDSKPSHAAVTATVTVTVVNVNEYSPEFGQHTYAASVLEGSDPGTQVTFTTSISATDEDGGSLGTSSITYSLTNDRGLFRIDPTSGSVSVMSNQTDREREDRYYMVVVATDGGGLQQTVPLTINITDRNDNTPVFLRDQYDVILDEGATQFRHSASIKLEATDADEEGTANSNVTYSISSTSPAGVGSHFHLDPLSGQLNVTSALDYDVLQFPQNSAGIVKLVVVAKDKGSTRLSASVTVAVTLNDINDNGPSFQDTPYSTSIPERSNAGFFVFQVKASDQDGSSPNNVIAYSIESGGQDRFRINPDNGTITVSGDIDREQVQNYTLVVVTRDRAASPKSSSTRVTIDVTDVNDELPTFGDKGNVRVDANETFRGVLYTMSATDADSNSHLQYSILYNESSGQSGTFQTLSPSEIQSLVTINRNNGKISAASPLNRRVVQKLVLRVQVSDTNGTVKTPQIRTATMTITVVDINNHRPQFSPQGTVNATIRENMGQGTALTFINPLRITDLDEGENSLFEVHVVGPIAADFEVVPSTVQSSADLVVRVKNGSLLDYEDRTHLSIKLMARETHTVEKRSSTVTITVFIEDENDNSPHFNASSYDVSIKENEPVGTTVTTVHATDDDRSSEFNTVTYSLQGAAGLFSINESTGVVTQLINTLDYDILPNTYQLTVLASDSGGRRASVPLTVTLTDLNDNPPVFDRPVFEAKLKEGESHFDGPLAVHAVDRDERGKPNSNVSYSILSSVPQGLLSNFTMNNQYTGVIDVVWPVDFESLTSSVITLTVKATDGGTPGKSSTSSVEITVEDVNDHRPVFSPASDATVVLENATVDTPVYIFNAHDDDGQAPNNDSYYLISSGANDQFSVDSSTGSLTVSRSLDREKVPAYSLVVLAIDRGVPQQTGTATLNITVGDVNDVPPVFSTSTVSVDVNETSTGVLYRMNAKDEDEDHQLLYEIVWAESSASDPLQNPIGLSKRQNLFSINPSTGAISVSGTLDRETVQTAVFVVTVKDTKADTEGQTATGTVTINVLDKDDNPPVFSNHSVSVSVDENAAQGTPISMPQIRVSDADQGENARFNLRVVGAFSSTIQVLPATARESTVVVLQVGADNSALDYERNKSLSFQIVAEGTANASLKNYCTVTLNIGNVNDNLPQFERAEYTASINEGSAIGTSVTTVKANDDDAGHLGDVTYSMLGDNQLFSVDNSSGRVTTASSGSSYDRETTPEYFLTIMATDGGGATNTTRVHVTLDDVNDQHPVFLRPEYRAFLKENSNNFDVGVTAQATDNDERGTNNSEVSYSLQQSNWSSHFAVDSDRGVLRVVTPVDYEAVTAGEITLTVIASDKGQPPLSGYVNVTVTLQDENDFSPEFSQSRYSGNVKENSPTNSYVTAVSASDRDGSAPNNDVFYLIASGGNDKFKIDSDTGNITTIGDIDREARASYSLVVEAVDKGSPAKSASVTVHIAVVNVNDYTPEFKPQEVSVSAVEEQSPGTIIYNFTAIDNDEDADLNYTVFWANSTGQDKDLNDVDAATLRNAFELDSVSGTIRVNQRLDRETMETARLVIVATDTNAPTGSHQTATGTLSIQVLDTDDHDPTFSDTTYPANISENSPEGTPIQFPTPVNVTDLDKDANSQFKLSLSPPTNCLRISPTTARAEAAVVIRVSNASCFDYETTQVMNFKILANGTARSSEASVQLHIQNVDDNRPLFTNRSYKAVIVENAKNGSMVLTIHANDGDLPPFNNITYSLQGGDQVFSINSASGKVTVSREESLDYETRREYQLTVEATDTGALRDSVPLTVTLLDVNDNAPQFLRPEYRAFVKENRPDFDGDILITATDKDGDSNNEIRYSISPALELASNFTVNSTTGRLGLSGSSGLDFEALPNKSSGVVQLIIVASDSGNPSLSTSVSVLVTVADENDNPPVFAQVQPQNMSETAPLGASLVTVSATDGDGQAPNNKVFYVMSGGGNDKFKVDSSSGLVSRAGPLDSDTQNQYNLTISAIDGGSPANSDTVVITVTIDDVNDEPPEFQPASRIISVNESNEMKPLSDAGRVLTTLWATDPDANKVLLYDVVWTESRGFGPNQEDLDARGLQDAFELDSSSGEIKVHSSLDREALSRAVLVINVTDTNAAPNSLQTSTGTLTINVLDVNDHKPVFNQHHYVVEIQENAVENTVLKMVSIDQMNVSDSDTDQNCVFSVSVEGPESVNFTAEPSSARSFALVQLRVRGGARLDYEETQSINFSVTARETDTSDHFSDTVNVTLNIIDVNDNDPKFTETNYSVSVPENSKQGTNITRIQAQDKDSNIFGQITYSLEGDSSRFAIDPSTGDLSTADGGLDRETKDNYLMTVVATDGGGRRSGASLTITVTDINDQTPRFQSNYSTKVKENSVDLSPPVVLQAPDDDQSNTANSNVTYHLGECRNVTCANFSLNASSGHLVLNSDLDFEKTRRVMLVVEARDQGPSPLTGTATVTVEVEDVNDMDPKFSKDLYTANITENAPEGTTLTSQVSASDSDGSAPNNVVFYVLDSGKGSDKFRVNSITGVVTVGTGAVLDREADASFNLRLLAFDRGDPPRSSSTTLSVSLVDINDEGPVFADARKEVSVYENASVSQEVQLMDASDSDTDSGLVYTWLLGDSQATTDRDVEVNISQVAGWFRVDPDTGRVTVRGTLDREVAEVVVLKILVNDTKGTVNTPQTALATLTVTLLDVNDNAPKIIGSDTMSVSEALAVGTEVYSLTAHDDDKDQSVVFSMLTGTGTHFNISANGKIILKNQIDREVTPTVSFTVIATDSGSPPLSSNITFSVTVLDANDNDPKFQNTSYVFSVPEDAVMQTVVAIVNATDADEGPNADVTFDLADNVYDFVINTTTGAILVNRKLDRERIPSYMFGVAALDNPTTDKRRRAIQRITIEVQDVNDNAPVLNHQHYVGQIDETKEPGEKVLNMRSGAVQAMDADLGQNANLSFHMTSQEDVQFFRMDSQSGEVFVNTSIEGQAGTYNYTVTVADHGQPSLNASANLTIEIIDKNINTPRFVGSYTNIHVAECINVGASITTFKAEDDDRDKNTNGKVQFLFDNATSNAADLEYFTLNKDTGVLYSAKPFDRETQAQFHIGIIAQDKGLPTPLSATLPRVPITVSDANDQNPTFNTTRYDFRVRENQDNVLVGTVYAEDLDDYKRTCYGLVGDLNDHFNITATTDHPAEIRLIRPLDREVPREAKVSLTVTAYDCTETASSGCAKQINPSVSSTATVQVTVLDVNDNPPNFTKPLLTFGVASTADTGHVIVNLQEYVTDPDTGPNRVHAFYPVGDYELDKDLEPSFGPSDTPLAVTTNGTVATHAALPGDARGFFTWEIMVNDTAGNDTVILKIYVVGKDKLLRLTFFLSMEELRKTQDNILRDLSEQTGLLFVADDRVQFEDDKGIVDPSKSVLVVHAVKNKKDVMDANALWDFLDHEVAVTELMKNVYKLYNIQTLKAAEAKKPDKTKTEYILAAIICVLVVAFCITLYIMLNNIRRFKRKLKAATIETYAMAGQQKEAFPGLKTPQTNPIFGKDEDLRGKDFDNDNASEQSDDSLDQNSVDFDAVRAEPGDDEQEVTLDLYGEDTDQPPDLRTGGHYLDEALAEHERSKNPGAANGVGPMQNGALPSVLLQDVGVDLQGLESTEI